MEDFKLIISPNGVKHSARVLENKDWDEILALRGASDTTPLNDYRSFWVCETAAYLLGDNRVLLSYGGGGLIFDDELGYQAYLLSGGIFSGRKFIAEELPQTIVQRLFPTGRIITTRIPEQEGWLYISNCSEFHIPLVLNLPTFHHGDKCYDLPKGKVLLHRVSHQEFILYHSKQDLFDSLKSRKETVAIYKKIGYGKNSFMPHYRGFNPFEEEFIENISSLLQLLPTITPCPISVLELQPKNLLILEYYLYQNRISSNYREVMFLPLLAYIGEMLRANKGGIWIFHYDEYSDHYMPDIEVEGQPIRLFDEVFKVLDPENHSWTPLHAVYHTRPRN